MLRIRAAAGLVAALLLLSSGGSGIPAVPMRLVMEAVYGTHLPGLANLRRALPSSSSSVSSNPRSLARHSPQEILDKVSRGPGDAGLSTASFWAAKMPAPYDVRRLPFGPDAKGHVDCSSPATDGNSTTMPGRTCTSSLALSVVPRRRVGSSRTCASRRTSRVFACAASDLRGRVMSKLAGATVLETACRAMLLATLAESPRLQAALNELTKNGVRIETRSDKMMSAFRHAWHEVVNEEGDHDPMFKRVLEDLEEFRAPNADVSPSASAA